MHDATGMEGATVRLCGWAGAEGGVLTLQDHTGVVTVVDPDGILAAGLPVPGSAVEVTGTVAAGPTIVLTDLRNLGPSTAAPSLDEDASLDERIDHRHLDLRRPRNRLIFEVQTTLERAMRAWWADHGFLELHSPKLRAQPNMSGRELFTVDYFDRPAYLAQSPQFYKQMAICAGFDRVFEIGPVFRANPLLTTRHDTEFVSVDVEVAWIDSHEDVMAIEEHWLADAVAVVAGAHGADVERVFGRAITVPTVPFPRVALAEARQILELPAGDLDPEGERALAAHVAAAHGHELVFVTEYPAAVRPFYHMRLDGDPGLTRSFDLLWNGLEVTTGAQREHRHDRLTAQAGTDPARLDAVRGYLDFFRHGCPPHGGFGLGLTRVLTCLLGLDDVREATFVPRDRHRLTP